MTTAVGDTWIVDLASVTANISPERFYVALSSIPDRPALQQLVGARGAAGSRTRMGQLIPEEKEQGTALYLLMDDVPAAALISGQMRYEWIAPEDRPVFKGSLSMMEDICIGHAAGSSHHSPDEGVIAIQQTRPVPPLRDPMDPLAWHEHAPDERGPSMRRARRIDVWLEDGQIQVDAFFQDSGINPDGVRFAVHEYTMQATADMDGVLTSVKAEPRVLPFDTCPAAVLNVSPMVGTELPAFRSTVLKTLPGVLGCTHLNDMLRSLAEVPMLVSNLN
ncbi:MAG: DUF2889 domain-containing protein [Actinomycetota bacterium]|nr:DUF2889 domain-containing protein [Actinomycetota bacterium]